jgi:hypothetical protein
MLRNWQAHQRALAEAEAESVAADPPHPGTGRTA